jgi:hypothetical protein
MKEIQIKTFLDMRKVNVNDHVEQKDGLTYLTWSWAWDEFKQAYPDATYEVIKNSDGLPYFESNAGAICYTKVTVNGLTHEMWLPVMDSKNKAMKSQPYTYLVRGYKTDQPVERKVEAFSMFDVNKTLMRCLVKNLAMFGLGLYIYAGEDLPFEDEVEVQLPPYPQESLAKNQAAWVQAIKDNKATPEKLIGKLQSTYELTTDQIAHIKSLGSEK